MRKSLSLLLVTVLILSSVMLFTSCAGFTNGLEFKSYGGGTCSVGVAYNQFLSTKEVDKIKGDIEIPEKSPKGDRVVTLEREAFANCTELTGVTIPNSVSNISLEAFKNCPNLTKITVSNGNTQYHSIDNCLIETETNTLITGCKTSKIPDGVRSIRRDAFYGCTGLTSITIPNSVTSIGENAFNNCTGLTSITIPNSVTKIGENYNPFAGCAGLVEINMSEGNEYYHSIDNCLIETETNTLIAGCKTSRIPDYVKKIESGAFRGLTDLESIVIPESVTFIAEAAFSGCSGLKNIYYTGTEEQWSKVKLENPQNFPDAHEEIKNATIHYNYVPEE